MALPTHQGAEMLSMGDLSHRKAVISYKEKVLEEVRAKCL
eukprot:CAMPEP_0194590908 /NCGR_PEP_ID=MMETSP0292-20121207/21696_1 /TAXON_ID=39354 /ORGANISM="Heterosigma akashiwo, Strain CCMP2393" /LENGTH=39 /DNA_ID= /DNA_START= /DNA_END= /DNA_ORIENTATION=